MDDAQVKAQNHQQSPVIALFPCEYVKDSWKGVVALLRE